MTCCPLKNASTPSPEETFAKLLPPHEGRGRAGFYASKGRAGKLGLRKALSPEEALLL